jgi:hypothetical protein
MHAKIYIGDKDSRIRIKLDRINNNPQLNLVLIKMPVDI